MKKSNKFSILSMFLILTLFFGGCDSWIDTDLNKDPDAPVVVPMELIVPSFQADMAYDLGGNDAVRVTAIWMQQLEGVSRQSHSESMYQYTPSNCNNLWNSAYAGEMMDMVRVIELAGEQNSPHYAGVAKVCLANTLGMVTNLWGSIPYSDAFKGADFNLQPLFDTQQEIYASMDVLLTEAIADLQNADNAVALSGDMMLGDNVDAWVKVAYALKARFALQLSKVNNNAAYTDALANLSNAMTSSADDFQLTFGATVSGASPLYQFMDERTDVRMAEPFVEALKAVEDPRLGFYCDSLEDGTYIGSGIHAQNADASWPGSYVAAMDATVTFMSFVEQKFIEAEANFALGNPTEALQAYKDAVAASMTDVTGDAQADWLDANINTETESTLTLEKIMTQKSVALFGQMQVYSDFRRTGLPAVTPGPDATSELPRRYPYPQEEQTYNSNCPSGVSMNDRLWWDAQ